MANTHLAGARSQFVKFIVVGLISTGVNYGVFLALYLGSVPYLASMVTGFLAGTVLGFRLNKVWTFGVHDDERSHFPRYMIVYVISLILGLLFLAFLVENMRNDPRVANILTIGLTTCTNFIGTKWFVFKK